MRLNINRQFCHKVDLFSNEKLNQMNYNMGEFDQIIQSHGTLSHLSLAENKSHGLFYHFTHQNTAPKNKAKFELLYLTSQDDFCLKVLKRHKFAMDTFYYFSNFHAQNSQSIEGFLLERGCKRLNFVNIFKKSGLGDWKVHVPDVHDLKINCTLLNSFMSLGAKVTFNDYDEKIIAEDLILLSSYELSLQHGIELFRK